MTENKMTEKEIFALVGENAEAFGDKAELILEWVEKHIGQLDRKYSSKSGKLNAKQLENLEIKNEILERIKNIDNSTDNQNTKSEIKTKILQHSLTIRDFNTATKLEKERNPEKSYTLIFRLKGKI